MSGIPIRLDGLAAKIETTDSTDSVPTAAADAVRVAERVWSGLRVIDHWENDRDEVASSSIIPIAPAIPRGRMGELDIAWEVKGAGSDAVPEVDALLRACGCSVVDGTQLFTYSQASNLHESCSIYAWAAGALYKFVGCRGGFSWPITVGRNQVLRFRMRGKLSGVPAATALATFTYDSSEPVAGVNMALTVGAWAPKIITGEFNQGVEAAILESGNAADGLDAMDFAEAKPMFTLSARVPRTAGGLMDLATYDPYADALARTARTILATAGSTQFNRMKLTGATGYVQTPAPADNNRFASWDLRYKLSAWSIVFD